MTSTRQDTMIYPTAWAEIDLKAIRQNVRAMRQLVQAQSESGRTAIPEIVAVIKSGAYGHGMLEVAAVLDRMGIRYFGVSDVAEGVALRKAGFKQRILMFETTLPDHAKDIVGYDLIPTLCNWELAESLNRAAKTGRKTLEVHIKVDTGMGRLGVPLAEAQDFIGGIHALSHLRIGGLYTHFPVADTNPAFTRRQIRQLSELLSVLREEGIEIPDIHAANSAGLAGFKTSLFNLSRPGLMIYGLYPHPNLRRRVALKPAMRVKTRVIFIKDIAKGQGVSYGHTFEAPRRMRIAVLPIGYSNGYFRVFSNRAAVLIAGKRCPVVGNVTMDQIMVDVSRVPSVRLGDEAVILGRQKDQVITADELAKIVKTINYEILCSLGSRLPRVYID
jgi:alanine racemase